MALRLAGVGQASLGINNQVRLPRARSISSSRHWTMEAGGAAAEQSFSSTAPANRTQGRSFRSMHTNAVGGRNGSQFGFAQRTYNAGRQCARSVGRSASTQEDRGNKIALQQVGGTQYERGPRPDRDTVELHFEEMSHIDLPRSSLSGNARRSKELVLGKNELACGGDADMRESISMNAATRVVNRCLESGPNQLTKKLSLASDDAMRRLGDVDVQLKNIEEEVAQIDHARASDRLPPERIAQLKVALAQLEADAHKLETQGVDGIYTSSLVSGLACAKQLKKAQLQRLEVLFQLIEDIFRFLKKPLSDI